MITANHNAPHRRQQWGTVILRFKQLWSRYNLLQLGPFCSIDRNVAELH